MLPNCICKAERLLKGLKGFDGQDDIAKIALISIALDEAFEEGSCKSCGRKPEDTSREDFLFYLTATTRNILDRIEVLEEKAGL